MTIIDTYYFVLVRVGKVGGIGTRFDTYGILILDNSADSVNTVFDSLEINDFSIYVRLTALI